MAREEIVQELATWLVMNGKIGHSIFGAEFLTLNPSLCNLSKPWLPTFKHFRFQDGERPLNNGYHLCNLCLPY